MKQITKFFIPFSAAMALLLVSAGLTLLPIKNISMVASAQTPPPCTKVTGADAAERCAERYIRDEIAKRCSGSADAIERCAANTTQAIRSGDFNYNGVPDHEEQGAGANLQADCKPPAGTPLDKNNCGIVGYVVTFTRVLSALVGVVVVIMIAVGGLQFSMARDNPQEVAAAKNRIKSAVLALAFYLFGFALLQWLVPGGIL